MLILILLPNILTTKKYRMHIKKGNFHLLFLCILDCTVQLEMRGIWFRTSEYRVLSLKHEKEPFQRQEFGQWKQDA